VPTSKSKAANGANGVSEALAPDPLVPDRQVAKECGDVTLMTLWRWSHDAKYQDLNFPPPIKIKTRNYRSRRALDEFKQRKFLEAIAAQNKNRKCQPKEKPLHLDGKSSAAAFPKSAKVVGKGK
jgi:hypothetical protein